MPERSAERELRHQIVTRGVTPQCEGREHEFVLFKSPPSALVAELMCNGCPLFDLCREAVVENPPTWGVWAGHIFGTYRKVLK